MSSTSLYLAMGLGVVTSSSGGEPIAPLAGPWWEAMFAARDGVVLPSVSKAYLFQENNDANPVTASGQTVGKFDDQSGKDRDGLQATLANRPTYTELAGKNFLLHDGALDRLVSPFNIASGGLMGVAARPTAVTANRQAIFGDSSGATSVILMIEATSGRASILAGGTAALMGAQNLLNTPMVLMGVWSGTALNKWLWTQSAGLVILPEAGALPQTPVASGAGVALGAAASGTLRPFTGETYAAIALGGPVATDDEAYLAMANLVKAVSPPATITASSLYFANNIFQLNGKPYGSVVDAMLSGGLEIVGPWSVGNDGLTLSSGTKLRLQVPSASSSVTLTFDGGTTQSVAVTPGTLSVAYTASGSKVIRSAVFSGGVNDTLIEAEAIVNPAGGEYRKVGTPYLYRNSMWSALFDPTFTLPEDYTVGAIFQASQFPNGLHNGWRVPTTPPSSGVRGYPALIYGNYENSSPDVPITSRQVNAISQLRIDLDFDYAGGDQNAVLLEAWLTDTPKPTGSIAANKVKEFGAFVLTTAGVISSFATQTARGTFTDPGGRLWTIAEATGSNPPFLMFRVGLNEKATGTIYFKEMMNHCVTNGWLSGSAYFNGLGIGAEPYIGPGAVKYNTFGVTYS